MVSEGEFLKDCIHGEGEVRIKGKQVGTDIQILQNPICLEPCGRWCEYNKALFKSAELGVK
jgi:hypothetical protein